MKFKNTFIFLLIVLLIIGASIIAINGVNIGNIEISNARNNLDLGLDLAGGVYVLYEADTDATGSELSKIMEQTKSIINRRVDALGVSEPNIVIEGDKRIRVELAGINNSQEAMEIIGKTAQLQFVDTEGNVIVTGNNIKKSEVAFQPADTGGDEPVVALEFDEEGTVKFAEATSMLSRKLDDKDKIIFIVLDDEIISSPVVKAVIDDGNAVIEGGFDIQSASELAALIREGALPVDLIELESSEIGPTLGLESLDKSVFAAIIGLAIILLFMLIYYRIPGLVADLSLIIYILITLGIMIALGVKLTLPGIAGLILSIGMAVDANVIIFERIKEELRAGKTIRAAADSGFKRALTSILDANITTIIAGVVLFYFGTGPIKGFGVTLIIGIITSMLTAVFITKFLLKLILGMNITKNTKLYGV